jgi:hypothetical protein
VGDSGAIEGSTGTVTDRWFIVLGRLKISFNAMKHFQILQTVLYFHVVYEYTEIYFI